MTGHQQMQNANRLLSVSEAAAYLGISAASLRSWSNDGLVAVYRTPGRQRRYAMEDLEEFMRSMREAAPTPIPRLGRGGSVFSG